MIRRLRTLIGRPATFSATEAQQALSEGALAQAVLEVAAATSDLPAQLVDAARDAFRPSVTDQRPGPTQACPSAADRQPSRQARPATSMWSVQHGSLRRAYEYFRERALEPSVVEDETIEYGPGEIPGIESWVSFKIGTIQMQQAIIDNMDY